MPSVTSIIHFRIRPLDRKRAHVTDEEDSTHLIAEAGAQRRRMNEVRGSFVGSRRGERATEGAEGEKGERARERAGKLGRRDTERGGAERCIWWFAREREGAIHAVRTQRPLGGRRSMDGDGDGVVIANTTTDPSLPLPANTGATGALMAESVEPTIVRPQSTVGGLAKEAAQLFHARSYQGCLLILHQLQLHNDEDPKVGQCSNVDCWVLIALRLPIMAWVAGVECIVRLWRRAMPLWAVSSLGL